MKYIKKKLFCTFFYCFTSIVSAQYISVDDSYTAQKLIDNVLVNSSCASASNATIIGQNSYGYFNSRTSSFPFSEGVLLSTWNSLNSIGPFIRNNGGGNTSWIGDADLDQILGIETINATSLEFDFTPLTNFISFNYIFASNEYQDDFPCRYSDGFAFLIKEKGSTNNYENLAVIPGTLTPVSSENIRPLIQPFGVGGGCQAINENYFGGYNTIDSPINYSAQTIVLNAQTNVTAGKTYHIKLVIADDGPQYYDSAVFLQAGSFSPKIDLGPDRLTSDNPICFGESFTIDTNLPLSYSYKWFKDGMEIPLKTGPSLQLTEAGVYKVEVTLTPTTCTASDEMKVEYTPEIVLTNTTLTQCDDNGDGITVFDLTKADNIIKNNDTTLKPVVYYELLTDAQGKINPILNPTIYTNKLEIPILYARVTSTFNCANYAQVNLIVANNTIATQNPVSTCDGDRDGLYNFDLNAQVSPQVLTGLPAGMIVEYYLTSSDAVFQKNPLPNIFKNTTTNQQIIYARIINGADCYRITPITLVVNTFNPPNFQDEIAAICIGSSTNLSVASGYASYLWNTGANSNSIIVTTPGNYSVIVTDTNGCTKTKKYTVIISDIPTIIGAVINDFSGTKNTVLIQYTGSGDYEFSLGDSYFQDNPFFNNVATGSYLAYAKNSCGLSVPFSLYVLDYPRFLTPNGDGYNDTWIIKNLDLLPKSNTRIFDRYGKLLTQIDASSLGWDGTFNDYDLPASDYWFKATFEDGKIIEGHFTLKR